MDKPLKYTFYSSSANSLFGIYHFAVGIITKSLWMLTLGIYYLILCFVRFFVLHTKKEQETMAIVAGIMLMVLSIPLVGTVILSVVQKRGQELHLVIIIVMAIYAFTKITLAIKNFIKSLHDSSLKIMTLRNISLVDAFVSMFALQRTMLMSFEGMTEIGIQSLNISFGSAVCLVSFLLGLTLTKRKKQKLF